MIELTSRSSQASKDFFGPNSAKSKIPDDRKKRIQRKMVQQPQPLKNYETWKFGHRYEKPADPKTYETSRRHSLRQSVFTGPYLESLSMHELEFSV